MVRIFSDRIGAVWGAVLLLSACGDNPVPAPKALPSVVVAKAEVQPVQPQANFVGRTQASEDVSINAQVQGQLLKRHFVEGDDVESGALLFEIDPQTFEAQVQQQKALLSQAEASRDVAIMNWERGKKLLPDGMISAQDMDELTSRKLTTAAAVVQAQAALEAAQVQLGHTKIYAPISGRISDAKVSVGDIISPQTQMANLVQLSPMWVTFQAPERALITAQQKFRENQMGDLKLQDLIVRMQLPNGTTFDEIGNIDFVSNRVDAATGTLGLRAKFDNQSKLLLPGLFVTLMIESPMKDEALLIPQSAVQEDQQGRFVMVLTAENMVQKRLVELGDRFGINWLVISGLENGEMIVVDGLQKIRPGIEVKAVEQDVKPFSDTQ
ncbi:MAG: efflux RND transporter periplasmic adaptor subunit [Shewanella sp.]|nr:efflux RND transporter periplasmic adaptor subunit [Shewanella sp.]MCF1429996.1 efflux RND transporter periplasmic adaptor subunit [Shewanella sp.]MCF1438168.1 efflux RND transporter periplasmic adaptor subunit [Shewanella sp.]MCF1456428.1 efflux RND transporter periplasmic adaptor subunit [Shewanella sp.]